MEKPVTLTPEKLEQVCTEIRAGSHDACGQLVLSYYYFLLKRALYWMRKYAVPISHKNDVHGLFVVTALNVAPRFDSRKSSFATFVRYPLQSAFAEYVGKSYLPMVMSPQNTQQQHRLHATVSVLKASDLPVTFDSIVERCTINNKIVLDFLVRGSRAQSSVPLDAPVGNTGLNLQEVISGQTPGVLDQLLKDEMVILISKSLKSLDPREAEIVTRRHLSDNPETFESISHSFDISKERVRQIEFAALAKIRTYLKKLHVNSLSDVTA